MESNEPKLPWESRYWGKAFTGAFKKGIFAQRDGISLEDCPYKLDATCAHNDFRRIFRGKWRSGWKWSKAGKAWEQE